MLKINGFGDFSFLEFCWPESGLFLLLEYLQHIEARVTFSLGVQPTSDNEYKFWHIRRMAFIQWSLTGTTFSWYIRLNDTYKHDWHAFVQAFKKQFSSQKNAYYSQVEALNLSKRTIKQYPIFT